ncbi:hypothetical protein FHW88_003508 [Mucilaginibacter sp. SG538B]|nr:hypothetical protein [Mucilaginibacter sp. SG538B]
MHITVYGYNIILSYDSDLQTAITMYVGQRGYLIFL